jgi:hypothetical protein
MPKVKGSKVLGDLRLSVEDREGVAQLTGEFIAVQVYRELQSFNDYLKIAGCAIIGNCSNGSCNIIGNCSSSGKELE